MPGGTSVQVVILSRFSNACSAGVAAVAFAVAFGAAGAMMTTVGTPGVGSTSSGAVAATGTGGGAGATSATIGSGVSVVREGGMTAVLLSGARGAVEFSRVLLSAPRGADRAVPFSGTVSGAVVELRAVLLSGKGRVVFSGTRLGGGVAGAGAAAAASGATVAGGLAVGLPAHHTREQWFGFKFRGLSVHDFRGELSWLGWLRCPVDTNSVELGHGAGLGDGIA